MLAVSNLMELACVAQLRLVFAAIRELVILSSIGGTLGILHG
jgi:hypothetical protein